MSYNCPLKSCSTAMPSKILLVDQVTTRIEFGNKHFEIDYSVKDVTIRDDAQGEVTITQKNQQVPYKATILGSLVLEEERRGNIDYEPFFLLDWQEEYEPPELHFKQRPCKIRRNYLQGQRIELEVERAARYCFIYGDGVNAVFDRRDETGFDFKFSTGFYGSFWHDDEDSYTIKFKGDKLKAGEDGLSSQSKFAISRSKYSGMLQLIMQEDAIVCIA
ncbi:MAG: hypothetical protein HN348_05820 [Proteobacteria bacterium]|jgi:hypothetical protein|nr:hypothetical protein [Pseudomonadota bacterium]